jgi:hypothetical protein
MFVDLGKDQKKYTRTFIILRRTDRAPDHFWPTRWADDPGAASMSQIWQFSNIGLLLMSGPFCVQNPALCVNELCNTETLAG